MAEPTPFERKTGWFRALKAAGARSGDMLVAHALAGCMLRSEDCWPSREWLSGVLPLEVNAIRQAIGRLERAGALLVDRSARTACGRQGASTYTLALPFDHEQALGVFLEKRGGSLTKRAKPREESAAGDSPEAPRGAPGIQRLPGGAPEAPGDESRGSARDVQRLRAEPPRREGRKSGEEKEGKRSLFSDQKNPRTKRPDEPTPGLGGWTGLDVRRLAPPCEHGPLTLAWNKREGSWYAFCRAGCGKTFDPRHEQRAPYETDEQANEREAARRAHPPRPRPRYPYAPPSDDVAALTKGMSASA